MFTDKNGDPKVAKIVGYAFGTFIFILLLLGSVGTVDAGSVGIKTTFGKVAGVIPPGLYVKLPIVQGVTVMDTQTQKEQVDATAASNDLQNVTATVAVNFHVNPADAGVIFQNIGADYQTRVVDPAIQESIKSVTANYTAEQLITQREKAREEILTLLTTKLAVYGVNADSLNIVDFKFSDTFNTAIEAKVTAQQNALAAQNKLAQVQFEAQQTVATAKAQAEAIQIQAEAINSQGGASYVALKAIDKWNGVLPTQMIPGGTVPFIKVTP